MRPAHLQLPCETGMVLVILPHWQSKRKVTLTWKLKVATLCLGGCKNIFNVLIFQYIILTKFWCSLSLRTSVILFFLVNKKSVGSAVNNYKAKRQFKIIKKQQHLKRYFSGLCHILQYTLCHHSLSTIQLSDHVSIWAINNMPRTSQMCWYKWPICYCCREARSACGKALEHCRSLCRLLVHQTRMIKIRSTTITSHNSLSGKAVLAVGQMILQLFNIRSTNLITCVLRWTLHTAILKLYNSLRAMPKHKQASPVIILCRMLCSVVISCFSHVKVTDTAKEAEMGFMAWHISNKTRALIIWRKGQFWDINTAALGNCCGKQNICLLHFPVFDFQLPMTKNQNFYQCKPCSAINTALSFSGIPWAL